MSNEAILRRELANTAHRYHAIRVRDGAPDHKFWQFPNCPAESCRSAREALGLPQPGPLLSLVLSREPGEDG
jgi:hypothetical protein